MGTAITGTPTAGEDPGLIRGLWLRQLTHYPDTGRRYSYLAMVVLATIVLYYELYIGGAVAPSILQSYDISFQYYVSILVVGAALGAFGSLAAGLSDRWGRANIVTLGLLLTGLLTLFALPNASNGFWYGVFFALVSIVEGMVLVATPALVRDYSPQIGRASAMGFWTLGPVIGSLAASEVTSHTLSKYPAWQDQYRICGIVGLVVSVIALIGLRELSPQIRDQLMVSLRDRTLIEARAKSLDVDAATAGGAHRVLTPPIIGGALAISLFLALYYTAVAFAIIYLTTVFGFSQDDGNGILNWWWGAEAIALIAVGVASDRLRVRKPFMVAGAAGQIILTLVLIHTTGEPTTTTGTLSLIVALVGITSAMTYAPWMAAFTETVERVSPALTATGLAVWGWTIRAIVALLFLVIPHAIGSVTPLVDHGQAVQAAAAQVPPADLKVAQEHAPLLAQISQYSPLQIPPALLTQAAQELGPRALITLGELNLYKAQLSTLSQYGPDVLQAQKGAPGEWQNWLWVCVAGQAAFLPLMLLLTGRWSPKRAREDEDAHERDLERQAAELGLVVP